MIKEQKLWANFCGYLGDKKDSLTELLLFQYICEWLINNSKMFSGMVWDDYQFDTYLKYLPSEYVMKLSEERLEQLINRMMLFSPSSLDSMAMMLRNILWDMVAFKSKVMCPNCGDDEMRVLYDVEEGVVILSCDLCCWSQYENGEKWEGSGKLVPSKVSQLKKSNYLLMRSDLESE